MLDRNVERYYINAARGIAVFLMLWGHCVQYCCTDAFDFFDNSAYRFIYSFHMPLFMLISGYLFAYSIQKYTLKTLIIRRTQAMLQPIFMITCLDYYLTKGIYACWKGEYKLLLDARWIESLGGSLLWFLWCVLCLSLIAAIAFCGIKSVPLRVVVLILGVGVALLFPNKQMILFMYPYFFAGLCWARWKARVPKYIHYLKYASLVLFPMMLPFFQRDHYIYTTGLLGNGDLKQQLPIDLFRWAIGFAGSIFVLTLLELIFNFLCRRAKADRILFPAVSNLGEKSLEIYTLSVIFLSRYLPIIVHKIAEKAGQNYLIHNIPLYNYVWMPILAAVYAAVLWGVTRLMEKAKISRIIFGR